MMRRDDSSKIFKYPLTMTDVQAVEMPIASKILCVQTQGRSPCLWARVDPTAQLEKRTIAIYGTGHAMLDASNRYIGTFQLEDVGLVFHVFELSEAQPRAVAPNLFRSSG